jgi:hypothetical protein
MGSTRALRILFGVVCILLPACSGSPQGASPVATTGSAAEPVEQVGTKSLALAAPTAPLPPASCKVYGLTERGVSGNKLVSIGLTSGEASVVASFGSDADMSGIAAVGDPISLYGIAGVTDRNPGRLYLLNPATGERTTVLNTGYLSVGTLAARSDGTLWTWADAVGLVRMDPVAKTVKRMASSLLLVKQLLWVDDTLFVYTFTGQVYKWKDGQSSLTLVTLLQDPKMGVATPNANGRAAVPGRPGHPGDQQSDER